MSLTSTTLNGAVAANDTSLVLTAVTGVSAPVYTTGSGFTYLYVEGEMMFVTAFNATTKVVNVLRGQLGTRQIAHATATPVEIGGVSDFPNFIPSQAVDAATKPVNAEILSAPVVSAATVAVPGPFFHITGTTQIVTFTVPAAVITGGQFTAVFDGSGSGLTWTTGGNIAVAGTATTAASAVTFFYDTPSAKWIPSRLA